MRLQFTIKVLTALEKVHIAQAKNYLVAYGFEIGLLINFGASSLEYRRIFNDKKDSVNPGVSRQLSPDSDGMLQ